MSNTDTPRVDAAEISMDRRDLLPIAKLPEYARLARALERELAEMTRQRDAAFRMSRCECQRDECCANLVRWERENRRLREALQPLVKMDDLMRDETWEDSGTFSGAYYAYYKGNSKEWDAARAALAGENDHAQPPATGASADTHTNQKST